MGAKGGGNGRGWKPTVRRIPLCVEGLERRPLLSTFFVINTADSGAGSLRQAITDANNHPGGDEIDFNIPTTDPGFTPASGGVPGFWTIKPLSALPVIARDPATPGTPNPVTIDATTQPGYAGRPIIQIDGTLAGAGVDGLAITAGDSTVKGLSITQFQLQVVSGIRIGGSGIHLSQNGGNTIQGDYLGPDVGATARVGNGRAGLFIENSANNLVGGTGPGQGNLLSSNRTDGLFILGTGSTGNVVQGNAIGTNFQSDTSGNLANLIDGVEINGASGNLIGGTLAGAANVIARNNGNGISIRGPGADNNMVQGNFIGTDSLGDGLLGNLLDGVFISGGNNNLIGGSVPGAQNVIGLNRIGIDIEPATDPTTNLPIDATGNLIQGNDIGFIVGPLGIATRLDNLTDGIALGASNNTVGGTAPGARNVVSRNGANGIHITGRILPGSSSLFGGGNVIEGNRVGTDPSGFGLLPNGQDGVLIQDSSGNTVGPGNLLSGNAAAGLGIVDQASSQNLVIGNFIGTGPGGSQNVGNTGSGIQIVDSGSNTIGGSTAAARNVIAANQGSGVLVMGFGATANVIAGNYVGTDGSGKSDLGNKEDGIQIAGSASGNVVGGTATGAGNVISANKSNGVSLSDGAINNLIQGNLIGVDVSGSGRLGNSGNGVLINDAQQNTIGGTASGAGNTITSNQVDGIFVSGLTATGNVIQGNLIGVDSSGTLGSSPRGLPLGNVSNGIAMSNASGNLIGGSDPAARNVISANLAAGVLLFDVGTTENQIQGNYIGTDRTGTVALGNQTDGIQVRSAPANLIGGSTPGAGNLISANQQTGIRIQGTPAASNVIEANVIGLNSAGRTALPNVSDGIEIDSAPNNVIGQPGSGLGNVISGNAASGIDITGSTATGTVVQNNQIGTDSTGTIALGNQVNGIEIDGAFTVLVGGPSAGTGNLVSGNGQNGIVVTNLTAVPAGASPPLNTIQGNTIGTNASGTQALPNGNDGVFLSGALLTLVGGTTQGTANLISGNGGSGVEVNGNASTANQILGNTIGTTRDGESALGNVVGIFLSAAPGNTIGGTTAGARNLISGNTQAGIQILGFGASANLVQGNVIGVDAADARPLSNSVGVFINDVSNNTVGGTTAGAGNTISGNLTAGVYIFGPSAAGNVVAGNIIGLDSRGVTPIAFSMSTNPDIAAAARQNVGVLIDGSQGNVVGGSTGNTISGNLVGVELSSFNANLQTSSLSNQVLNNRIGTDRSGLTPEGNLYGIYINGLAHNVIGLPGLGNVISGNSSAGIEILGSLSTGNVIQANTIGLGQDGRTAFRQAGGGFVQPIGVGIQNASKNTIGGSAAGQGNVIAGNVQAGVYILGQANSAQGNTVLGNNIGIKLSGGGSVGNTQYGVLKFNAASNTVVQSGKNANHFQSNGIANVREYTGPVKTSNSAIKKKGNHPKAQRSLHSAPTHEISRR